MALLVLPAGTAAGQSPSAQPHCKAVGGSVITNFIAADRTLGPASGDIAGAVSALLLGVDPGPDGALIFRVQHHWTTETGDTILFGVASATAVQILPNVFAITSYPLSITGGTGRFSGATGRLQNIGTVDLTTGRTVFRYAGQVCFQAPTS